MSTENQRVSRITPLQSPDEIKQHVASNQQATQQVIQGRQQIRRILQREDPRTLVIVGPCSIHDPAAAIDYAQRLKKLADELSDSLCIVMRAYFEKPRTTVGWKGFINDPDLDNRCDINSGLLQARHLLTEINALGLPVATEFLDTIIPQYIGDLISWGAIGARTCESQNHRNLASGLSMPIGIKNSTTGNTQAAIDGIKAANHSHSFLGVNEHGMACIVHTKGNIDSHIILRGGSRTGPNYDHTAVQEVSQQLQQSDLATNIMIDCSHGNSEKDHRKQQQVLNNVAAQITAGEHNIIGVMLESFIAAGSQPIAELEQLEYGKSVTDACIDWPTTVELLTSLAQTKRQTLQQQVKTES